jgi:mevalonate kinase
MKENDAWDDMITRQKREIPDLENMLSAAMKYKKQMNEETATSFQHLKKEMHNQQDFMDEIKHELAKQQRYLANEKKVKDFPINSLLMQNALRERIRIVEKNFLDLKCNYLNYLASSL